MLGRLRPEDLIETGIYEDDSGIALASSEIITHRAVYKSTSAQAIVHTHPPHAVVLSLAGDAIVPIDSEGSYLLHRVPVVVAEKTVGSEEMAGVLSEALRTHKACMLRGHGLFCTGNMLEEAFQWSSAVEASARIVYLTRSAGITPVEYRKKSEGYEKW